MPIQSSMPLTNDNNLLDEVESDNNDDDCLELSNAVVPQINCPEKIVICLDLSEDNHSDSNSIMSEDKSMSGHIDVLKDILEMYFINKSSLNTKNEYALVSLVPGSARWTLDFTKDFYQIISAFNRLESFHIEPGFTYDYTNVFKVIARKAGIYHDITNISMIPPPFTVRVIFVYNSSHVLPTFSLDDQHMKELMSSPYFTFDVLYFHEPASDDNKAQEIFDELGKLDFRGTSYLLEASWELTKMYNAAAKLLAHPLQRTSQTFVNHNVEMAKSQYDFHEV